MTPPAQTALVNAADLAQAPGRTALHVVKPSSTADLVAAEQAGAAFLVALGVDLDSESLATTPARMARAYAEMFSPRPFDLTTFPQVQERLTQQVADWLRDQLAPRLAPSSLP